MYRFNTIVFGPNNTAADIDIQITNREWNLLQRGVCPFACSTLYESRGEAQHIIGECPRCPAGQANRALHKAGLNQRGPARRALRFGCTSAAQLLSGVNTEDYMYQLSKRFQYVHPEGGK